MENPINITMLNDFIFCPASIYFHLMFDGMSEIIFQSEYQLNGKKAHESVDNNKYSGPASLQGLSVYCEKYNLIGKIDIYEISTHKLIERKKHINTIYDGYIFQLYAQYFAMLEMGYKVDKLIIRSIDDNKNYMIKKPEEDSKMMDKFEKLLCEIEKFDINSFKQNNPDKCKKCIYSLYCDREAK